MSKRKKKSLVRRVAEAAVQTVAAAVAPTVGDACPQAPDEDAKVIVKEPQQSLAIVASMAGVLELMRKNNAPLPAFAMAEACLVKPLDDAAKTDAIFDKVQRGIKPTGDELEFVRKLAKERTVDKEALAAGRQAEADKKAQAGFGVTEAEMKAHREACMDAEVVEEAKKAEDKRAEEKQAAELRRRIVWDK